MCQNVNANKIIEIFDCKLMIDPNEFTYLIETQCTVHTTTISKIEAISNYYMALNRSEVLDCIEHFQNTG